MPRYTTNDNTGLTEQEELYCQHRADGRTKTNAAKLAYPSSDRPSQQGHKTELKEKIQVRIRELKAERAEAYGLDAEEQIRRYNELYFMALDQGQLAVARSMLERLDAIGGFDAPKRSESVVTKKGESFKDLEGDVEKDTEKFLGILGKHSEEKGKESLSRGVTSKGDTSKKTTH